MAGDGQRQVHAPSRTMSAQVWGYSGGGGAGRYWREKSPSWPFACLSTPVAGESGGGESHTWHAGSTIDPFKVGGGAEGVLLAGGHPCCTPHPRFRRGHREQRWCQGATSLWRRTGLYTTGGLAVNKMVCFFYAYWRNKWCASLVNRGEMKWCASLFWFLKQHCSQQKYPGPTGQANFYEQKKIRKM